jgi:phosphatidate cytidylyltransferase
LLGQRLLSALIIISCSLGFVALDALVPIADCQGLWMTVLAIYLMLGSAVECSIMLRHRPGGFDALPALLGCGGIMLASTIPMLWPLSGEPYPDDCRLGALGWPLAAAMIALVANFVWFIPKYVVATDVLARATLSGWVSVYFGIGFAFWVALRQIPAPALESAVRGSVGSWGLTLVVGVIVVTKFTDAGAYFSGRTFGRTKLCPAVSPGKTVEGLAGGMIVGVVASLIYFRLFTVWLYGPQWSNRDWAGPILLGIFLTLAGLAGDLLESIVKRETQFKDSSHFLPGLGGLWDVTDSLLPAGVVGYLIVAADLL